MAFNLQPRSPGLENCRVPLRPRGPSYFDIAHVFLSKMNSLPSGSDSLDLLGCRHFLTVYTRHRGDGIVRRKRCRNCGKAIMTREKGV